MTARQSLQRPSRSGSAAIGVLEGPRFGRFVPGSELLEALLVVVVGGPPDGGAEALGEAHSRDGRSGADEGRAAGASRDAEDASGHYIGRGGVGWKCDAGKVWVRAAEMRGFELFNASCSEIRWWCEYRPYGLT